MATTRTRKIDINSASKEELMSVPGIGSGMADAIIEYRNRSGRIESLDDLKNIPRIGNVRAEDLEEYFSVGGSRASESASRSGPSSRSGSEPGGGESGWSR